MDAQEIQGHEKVSSNWVKNLKSTVNKINKAMPSMINRKPIDAIKLNIVELDKSETRADNNVLPEDGLDRDIYMNLVKNMVVTKNERLALSGVKIHVA